MEFEFVTDANSAMQILKLWNIRLLESIPPSQHFSDTPTLTTKHNSSKERCSFRTPKAAPIVQDNDLKRAGSFSKMHTLGTGLVGMAALPGRRSWGGSNEIYPSPVPSGGQLSQDSVFNSLTSPPPLPPRPEESDSDDPDYSYIDERKVKGPENQRGRSRTISSGGAGGRMGSPTLDDQLEELKKSIMRENKKKKRDKAVKEGRKAATLHFPSRSSPRSRLPMNFARADPEDYLEPVASKRITSTSSEGVPKRDKLSPNIDNLPRSLSDHSGNANHSSSSSIGTAPCEVFDDGQSPPDAHVHNGSSSGSGVGMVGPGGNPPALPPRPWRNSSVTSTSSISSATSPSSANVPPLTNNTPTSSRPSISEEMSILEEEKEKHSPILGSPKGNGSRRASNSEQMSPSAAASAVVSNDGQTGSKDGSSSPVEMGSSSVSPPPPLPPRSPTRDRERLSRKSSSSSVSSNASSSRCPKCRSLKKTKAMVGKTSSLDPRGIQAPVQNLTKEENRKSLPDLNNTSPFPENNLALNRQHHGHNMSREHNHGHSCGRCSVGSSTDGFPGGAASNGSLPASSSSQNFEYLQLLSEEGERGGQQQQADIDTDVSPALDLLSSCLQDLEYLENKVNQQSNSPPNSNSQNLLKASNRSPSAANEQRRMAVQTDINAAMRQTELVQADLNMCRRSVRLVNSVGPDETRKMVANGHPPLLKKQNTLSSYGSHSSSTSPSPPASGSASSSSSGIGPLHWTQQPHPQSHPQPHPQPTSRPLNHTNGTVMRNSSSSSLVSNPASVASPLSVQSPTPVFSPTNNNTPFPTAATVGGAMGGAPPVPPRSLVSLGGEAQPSPPPRAQPHGLHMMGRSFSQSNSRPHTPQRGNMGLSKSNSLGRHMGTWKSAIYGDPHAPQRSTSAARMSPGMVGGPPPAAFHNQNHVDSQTVFVHHLNRSGNRHSRQIKAHLV